MNWPNAHDQSWAQIKRMSKQRVIVINIDPIVEALFFALVFFLINALVFN